MFLHPRKRGGFRIALMAHRLFALAAVGVAVVSAATCPTQTVMVQCISRCDNSSGYASSNPPPEQVLLPPNVELSSVLPDETSAKQGKRFGIFMEMAQKGGSPTVPTVPNDQNFSDQTVYAPAHRALSPEQLMALVGPVHAIEWLPVKRAAFGCVDGRHSTGGVYAYGGDLGEFTLALSVLEHVAQRPVGQAETTQLLEGWLKQLQASGGGFGACVDAAAAASLASAVGISDPEIDLSSPPEEARPALLLRLVAPEFVGSEHMRWLLRYPKTYATRRPLVEQAIRSFYGILWNPHHPSHAALRLDTVSGQRAERAVVRVHASHWCAAEQGLAPALPTKTPAGSIFVYHPDAVATRRDALVRYLSVASSTPVDRADFGGRVRTLGDGQAALTEKALAGMLRGYSLIVK